MGKRKKTRASKDNAEEGEINANDGSSSSKDKSLYEVSFSILFFFIFYSSPAFITISFIISFNCLVPRFSFFFLLKLNCY